MRISAVLALFALFAGTAVASPRWRSTIEEASTEARASSKPLLLDFRADWCAPCRVMDKEVYTDAFFASTAQRLIPVQIDFDKQRALARKYNVESLPTIVFTDSYGTELFQASGYIGPKTMDGLLEALPKDIHEFNRLGQLLSADPKNLAALTSMGRNLRAAGLFLTSNDYLTRALARADRELRPGLLEQTGRNFLDLKQSREAASTFEKVLKEFPGNSREAAWTIALSEAYSQQNKPDRARKFLDAYLATHPAAADVRTARATLK